MKLHQFLVACNFNRPAAEILADLIWLSTKYRVSLPHTVFLSPRPLDQRPDMVDDTNTYITAQIDPNWDAEFPGDNGFLYYRVPLAWVTQGKTLVITHALPYSTHEVLDEVNAQLELQLTSQDVLDQQYTDEQQSFELVAAPQSLVWCNAAYPDLGPYDLRWLDILSLNGLVYTVPGSEEGLGGNFNFSSQDDGYTPDPNFSF